MYSPAQLARLLRLPEPTPEQAAVIAAPLGPLAVVAGAGSGKSETMAARLVWLVANGMVRPERVLGLTFTRKAAAELAERVRSRLDGLRRAGLARPGEGLPDDRLQADPVIATYHSYAGRLVADHALREAVEPSLRLVTPAVSWQLAARVVAAYDGPMDAISWTPSTVTAAVLDLSGELAEHLRRPAEVTEVGEWLCRGLRAVPRRDQGGGIRAIGVRGVPGEDSAPPDQQGGGIRAIGVRGVPGEDSAPPDQQGGGIRAIGVRGVPGEDSAPPDQHSGGIPAPVQKILQCQRVREQLLPMVAAYAAAKAAREVMDYGDQMALAARIADRHPEVGTAERARYQVVLLDEYQDTSHAQLVLLRALFGGGHPVTAVGDPCQSIYGWRGASAGNLRRFAQDFRDRLGRPAPVCQLSTSFRNAGRVLDTAAVLQEELRAEAPDVPLLQPAPDRGDRGGVCAALLPTVTEEADWVAAQAAALLTLPAGMAPDGLPWPDGRPAGVRPSDIAVLCRKRSQFVPLRKALEARGIPCEVVGLGGLLSVPEVQDVVATLRVLHDAASSDALARLLTGPRWRIGPRDLVALGRRARQLAAPARADDARQDQAEAGHPQAADPQAGDPQAGDPQAGDPLA